MRFFLWRLQFRSPITGYRIPPKVWVCVNDACPEAYGSPRHLGTGRCKRCGCGLRRI